MDTTCRGRPGIHFAYINRRFGQTATRQYAEYVERSLNHLCQFPRLGTLQDKNKGIRGLVIRKHTSVFYLVQKERLIVLNVFDNRIEPDSKW